MHDINNIATAIGIIMLIVVKLKLNGNALFERINDVGPSKRLFTILFIEFNE